MKWLRYAIAPIIGLILYWRVPTVWFVNDDFARLALPIDARENGLLHALFAPIAQGTVRVLGERLFFLTFSGLFGLQAWPFLTWMMATWAAVLMLIQGIGDRLIDPGMKVGHAVSPLKAGLETRRRPGGLPHTNYLPALIWAANTNATLAVIWPSAYYEIAGAFCLLAALYSRLRWAESGSSRWRIAEWVAYLAGFGSIETMVLYPFIAVLHALCFDRKLLRSTAWLFAPAVLYTALHFLLIPKSADSVYALSVDGRMPSTIAAYLAWMLEPGSSALGSRAAALRIPEMAAGALLGLALLWFLVSRLTQRQWAAVFFCGFFGLMLAPFLLIPGHVMAYYLTIPSIGVAWLAGWALSAAWEAGMAPRIAAAALAGMYFIVSAAGINAQTKWFAARGQRMRMAMEGVRTALTNHPGTAVALKGVDADLFDAGFLEHPFRLVGATQVWLTPDTSFTVPSEYRVSPNQLQEALTQGRARLLDVSQGRSLDITPSSAQSSASSVDVGNPLQSAQLGPTWYPAENGFRWSPQSATVVLSGAAPKNRKLQVTGYAPAAALAAGPVTLTLSAGPVEIGHATLSKPDQPFVLEFPMPEETAGRDSVEISVNVSRTFHPAGDTRELGLVFGTFSLR